MPLPPEWLVAWTEYLSLVITVVAAVLALLKGRAVLALREKQLRRDLGV